MKIVIKILAVFVLIGCGNEEKNLPDNFDYGTIEGNTYQNDFFDMEISFNPDWHAQSEEQMHSLAETGKDIVGNNNESLKSVIKASEVNTANLFGVFKFEVGAAVPFNPSLLVVAENKKNFPGIKEGKDYLFHTKTLLKQSGLDYYFEKDIYSKTIGNLQFDVMEANMKYLNNAMTQEFISTVTKGFSLSFILSYTNEEDKNELYEMIEAIKI